MHNPLDVTGAALIDTSLFGDVISALAEDPNVGFVGAVMDLPMTDSPVNSPAVLDGIGAALGQAAIPGAFVETFGTTLKPQGAAVLAAHGLGYYLPSLRDAVGSLARIGRWSERVRVLAGRRAPAARPAVQVAVRRGQPLSEASARALLTAVEVPVVPGGLATDEDQAVKIAVELGGEVAIKVVSPDVAHKTDIGGVVLGVQGDDLVRAAYRRVRASVDGIDPVPRVEGVLVTAMRTGGIELLVGVVRDPSWGPVLAVGTGGVFVEVLRDARLLLLPAHEDDVRAAVLGLRSAPLLGGVRGLAPADIDELVRVITRIGELALSLGEDLEALEINPLRVDGATVEALDVLVSWRDGGALGEDGLVPVSLGEATS
jgi:acyl-CoA synthetase (NDP forming)